MASARSGENWCVGERGSNSVGVDRGQERPFGAADPRRRLGGGLQGCPAGVSTARAARPSGDWREDGLPRRREGVDASRGHRQGARRRARPWSWSSARYAAKVLQRPAIEPRGGGGPAGVRADGGFREGAAGRRRGALWTRPRRVGRGDRSTLTPPGVRATRRRRRPRVTGWFLPASGRWHPSSVRKHTWSASGSSQPPTRRGPAGKRPGSGSGTPAVSEGLETGASPTCPPSERPPRPRRPRAGPEIRRPTSTSLAAPLGRPGCAARVEAVVDVAAASFAAPGETGAFGRPETAGPAGALLDRRRKGAAPTRPAHRIPYR